MKNISKQLLVIIIITMGMSLLITECHAQNNSIDNVFDELFFFGKQDDKGEYFNFAYDLGYQQRYFRETGFSDAYGYKDVTLFINQTMDGRSYAIESGIYRNRVLTLSARVNNDCFEVQYEYLYYVDSKALRTNVYVYYLQEREDALKEVNNLREEAKNTVERFLLEYLTNNEGKTKFKTDDWGSYEVWPGEQITYK